MRLADLDVLIIDCQTTGATPALGDLLEVGWTVAAANRPSEPLRAHRVALPEGRRVPRIIAKLTGLDVDTEGPAVAVDAVWDNLSRAAQRLAKTGLAKTGLAKTAADAPTVIHFARFELVFLRDLHARFGDGAPFPFDVVCAHDIARRLFPDLPRRGLRALAGYFGHRLDHDRRSASHTEATVRVWRHLVRELAKHDVSDWDRLRAWLDTPAPAPSRRRAFPMQRERRLALPDAPGVYRMLRSNGDVLYIGKALSLRQRVSSHFTQGKTSERALEMLTQVHDIDVTETPTALEAALLETDEIKRLDPPYNVQLRKERSAWFVSPQLDDPREAPLTPRWIGPLPSRWALSSFAAVRSLAMGETVTPSLLARAVGAPGLAAPALDVFIAGWVAFVERHIAPQRSRTWWGRFVKATKTLYRASGELDEGEGTQGSSVAWSWDPERVRRHLERATLQGGQLLRRARWLDIASECSIAFRESADAPRRLLVVSSCDVVEARDLQAGEPPSPPRPERPRLERMSSFDGARYDRVRVLTTELKRVIADGGEVEVRLDERPPLTGGLLARAFDGI